MTEIPDGTAFDNARFMLRFLLHQSKWMRRRVETFRFKDDETLMVRVSNDFDLMVESRGHVYLNYLRATGRAPLVPVAFLAKRPLEDFDLRDAGDKPLPLLTQQEVSVLSLAILMEAAEGVIGNAGALKLASAFEEIVTAQASVALRSVAAFGQEKSQSNEAKLRRRLLDQGGFRYLLLAFATNFLAIARYSSVSEVEKRTIIKYSYAMTAGWEWSGRSLPARFGLIPARFYVEVPLMRASHSYHVDIEAPEGLELRDVQLQAVPLDATRGSIKRSERRRPRAHLHVQNQVSNSNDRFQLAVAVSPRRRGFVRSSLIASIFCLVAMAVVHHYASKIAQGAAPASASLLLVIPGLLIAHLSRPSENPVATRLYFGMRVVLGMSALASWAVAMAIALEFEELSLQRWAMSGMLVTTVSLMFCAYAYFDASAVSDRVLRRK